LTAVCLSYYQYVCLLATSLEAIGRNFMKILPEIYLSLDNDQSWRKPK